jgi:hypothetical protein
MQARSKLVASRPARKAIASLLGAAAGYGDGVSEAEATSGFPVDRI